MSRETTAAPALSDQHRAIASWLGIAVGVLVLAGVFAILLVIGRMPPFDRLFDDPLIFRRGLVVHVNLALVFWFYSFVAALLFLLPRRTELGRLARVSPVVACAGVLAMAASAAIPGAEPVLSNYIPAIDHPLFGLGQLVFAFGVLGSFADGRLLPRADENTTAIPIPAAAIPGLRATAIALFLAALTFFGSWLKTPTGLHAQQYYETLFWGGGHVLQLASATAMASVWLILLSSWLGRSPISRGASAILFALMVLPWLFAPRLPMMGTQTWHYRAGFTTLMQFGIFPSLSILLGVCMVGLWRGSRSRGGWRVLGDYRVAAFMASVALTGLGILLGALIRGSNTMVPAHYHASIGGVTVAFMGTAYWLLEALGAPIPTPRLRRMASAQPYLFGVGQMVFAAGFATAGAHGMARKAYGAEQVGRSLAQSLGLAVMGIGGMVAVAGGVLFLWIVISAWRARVAPASGTGREACQKPPRTNRARPAPAVSASTR